jgi:hypothetical protein
VPELSQGQLDVAAVFFGLPESEGFMLVGGAALIALQLVDRLTEDLDFFTADEVLIDGATSAFVAAVATAGWTMSVVRSTSTFRRLTVTADGELVRVDLAVDSPPRLPGVASSLGPTLAPLELAARKLLALFDRAQPRDFVDVYGLTRLFTRSQIFELAREIDPGLDAHYLQIGFAMLDKIPGESLPCDASVVEPMRAFFREWHEEL